MPSIQDIEKFKARFRSIGHEEEIRSQRGEDYPDVPPPTREELPDDLKSLLETGAEEISEASASPASPAPVRAAPTAAPTPTPASRQPAKPAPVPEEPEPTDFGNMDYAALLENLPIETEEAKGEEQPGEERIPSFDELEAMETPAPEIPSAAAREPESPPGKEEEFGGLESLFEEGGSEPVSAGVEPTPEEAAGAAESIDEFGGLEDFEESPPSQPESFDIPDLEAEPESVGDEFSPGETAFEPSGAAPDEGFESPLPTEPSSEIPEFPDEVPSLPESEEDFGLPEDSSFGVESEPASGEATGSPAPAAGGTDEFSLPDNFESFDFNEGTEGSQGGGASGFGSEAELKSLESEFGTGGGTGEEVHDTFALDEFNIGDFSAEFAGAEEQKKAAGGFDVGVDEEALRGKKLPGLKTIDDVKISEADFEKLQKTLAAYPLNVRVACERALLKPDILLEDVERLMQALVNRVSVKEAAQIAGGLLGETVQVPKGLEKKSGLALEEEKKTFSYAFRKNILPVVRASLLGAVGVAMLIFLGFEYLYKPIAAQSLYRSGYADIAAGNPDRSEDKFVRAVDILLDKNWFYRYAEAYAAKKQPLFVEKKYQQLLKLFPTDKKGILDYAGYEWKTLLNFENAEKIDKRILETKPYDQDALLLLGDLNMDWAMSDPAAKAAKLEKARKTFALLIERYGLHDEFLERMLVYFIRTNNQSEVFHLKDYFLTAKNYKPNASIFAELGGYLVDISKTDDVPKILDMARKADNLLPEVHYQFARFYGKINNPGEEMKALRNSIRLFEASKPLLPRRIPMLVDSYERLGLANYVRKEYITTVENYNKAIALYEDALGRRLLAPADRYGKLYADMGDVYYFVDGDLATAYSYYGRAVQNGYKTPDLSYKLGFLEYSRTDYADALGEFFDASNNAMKNPYLLFATANTLFARGDYYAAQGYFTQVVGELESIRDKIGPLSPRSRSDHAELAKMLSESYNNLGVTLERLAKRSGDRKLSSKALVYLYNSSQYYDMLNRDASAPNRSDATDLASLNSRGIVLPTGRYEPQIYAGISRTMDIESLAVKTE
jgi:hypothetical protein